MSVITFDRFEIGIDLRKASAVSGANRLRVCKNAYVTTGWSIRKRPGLTKDAALEAGTVGLVSGGGKLNTFYNRAAGLITHANSLFQANPLDHPNNPAVLPAVILGGFTFLGYLYLAAKFDNSDVYHYYLDAEATWQATTAYGLNARVQPSVPNGYFYECTTAGNSGAGEPVWPIGVGNNVNDGTVVWTCRSKVITDVNCPHSASISKNASKVFAIDGDTVGYSATDDARDWTTGGDAGFLATGLQANGSDNALALGNYQGDLVVFFLDAAQVWNVDPDPTFMSFNQTVDGVGTKWPQSVGNLAGDVFFRGNAGYRSISLLALTSNLADVDVGSAIDKLLKDRGAPVRPVAAYHSGGGQYVCVDQNVMDVYSFSRTAKISAWSTYEFGVNIDDLAPHDGQLYLRSGNDVFHFDENAYADDGTNFEVLVELPFLDFKKPGVEKMIHGMDVVMTGSAEVAFRFKENEEEYVTDWFPLTGNTRGDEVIPVQITSTAIAPMFRVIDNQEWELHALNFYYEELIPA